MAEKKWEMETAPSSDLWEIVIGKITVDSDATVDRAWAILKMRGEI